MSKPVNQERPVDLIVCPVCAMQIRAKAEIEIQPEIGEAKADGTVALNVTTRMVRFNVNHICTGPIAAEPVEETQP